MNIQLAVLDMAGTTVRDEDAVNMCLRQALAADRVTVTRDDVNTVMGLPKPEAIGALLRCFDLNGLGSAEARTASIHDDFLRRMMDHYRTSADVAPMPYAAETIRTLRAAGIRVALDTGFSRPIVEAILERLGWREGPVLDATVASDEVPRGRPHPDLIHRAMQLTGVTDVRAVAKIGDTPSDLQEGTAAGCSLVIGVTNGTHTAAQLRPHPHTHLIASLQGLPPLLRLSAS